MDSKTEIPESTFLLSFWIMKVSWCQMLFTQPPGNNIASLEILRPYRKESKVSVIFNRYYGFAQMSPLRPEMITLGDLAVCCPLAGHGG